MFCKDPDSRLFNDVPADVAARYKPRLQCQPAGNWDSAIPYAGWDKIPSAYLLCEKDACLLPDVQRHMAEAAKCHIITASLGHMAMLVDPGQVAEKLLAFIRA
jgi:pimeloyl-ACP methyl ester carboxylesterase